MEKITFSLSPSSINLYRESQLIFYFSYILKSEPDTEVNNSYGILGSIVHETLEEYTKFLLEETKEKSLEYSVEDRFNEKCKAQQVETMKGMNGKFMDVKPYLEAVKYGKTLVEHKYTILEQELSLEYPLYEDDEFKIKVKGIIDAVGIIKQIGKRTLVDYKTNSSLNETDTFRSQGLHYVYLYWKLKDEFIPNITFEYIKIKKSTTYTYTLQEVEAYEEKVIQPLLKEILQKRTNIAAYELGKINGVFNQHAKKCNQESERRINLNLALKETVSRGQEISVKIYKGRLIFDDSLPKEIDDIFQTEFTYFVEGAQFSSLYKRRDANGNRLWDGKKRLYRNKSLPFGYIRRVEKIVHDYNEFFKKHASIVYKDGRTDFKKFKEMNESSFELRPYQKEAVQVALERKVGILYLGTGAGKTFLSCELLRKISGKSLFLVNKIELAKQTAAEYATFLGTNVGIMYDGNLDTKHQITISTIQTICSILKRKDESTKNLRTFLQQVQVVIYDECHGASDATSYSTLQSELLNVHYSIGLTGTPFRTK